MRTIQQQRAENALDRVNKLNNRGDNFKALYRSYVDSLGPSILMNGLGQALATETAASGPSPSNDREKAHRAVYNSVKQWLCRQDGGVYPSASDLLTAIMKNDQSRYLRAQGEALAWLEWHKKFCRAYLPADDGGGE